MPPSPPGDGRSRVRWGPVEEYYPQHHHYPLQPRRHEARYPARRSTVETDETPVERTPVRNDIGLVPRPPHRRSMDDVPVEVYHRKSQRQYRDAVPVQTRTEWEIPTRLPVSDPTGPYREYTESPRPIEDEDVDEKEEPTRQFSHDRKEYSHRGRSRSKSPIYYYYEAPRQDRYRSRETYSRTTGNDNDWYERPRADSFSSDDFDPYGKFDFSTQAQSIITESSKDDDSDVESPESEERVALARDGKGSKTRSQLAFIDSSLYTGNAETGSSHTATLNVIHDLKGQKRPLFKWLHVPQDVMNFEDLWVEISRISGLSELEKKAISRLRADVKKHCVKTRTNPKGAKVGYLEPKCIEVALKSLKQEAQTIETATGSARWICIPYFSLEQYSGLLAATSSSLFPAQTLLQFQYSRNTLARDMEQAVVQLGNAERGECFHISQLWCLTIDNSLIVTCGTMNREDLNGQVIEIKEHPARILTTERQGKILVAYGDSVIWSFEVEECHTWFLFLSKFQSFWSWSNIPEFWYKEQAITAEIWPKILKLASNNQSAPLKLTMKLGPLPEPPPRAILRPEPHLLPTTHGGKGKAKIDDFAHILALPAEGLKGFSVQNVGLKFLEVQLNAAESFLTGETTLSERKAYKSCKSATRAECYEYLTELASRVEDDGSDTIRRAYQEKVDIFNAADIVYSFFIPLKFNGPMVDKFWGAVRALVELPTIDGDFLRPSFDNITGNLRTSLRYLTRNLFALQNILAHSSKEERAEIELPVEFSKAWLYIVMGMVYSSKDDLKWDSRMKRAEVLIEKGSKKLVQGLCPKSLLDKVAVLPLEVLSLIIMGLLQDQVGKSNDICDTYSQYLNYLDNAITSKPSDRSFQHQIDMLQQELKAVNQTLYRQKSLISRLRKSLTAIDTLDIVISQVEHETALKNAERQHSSNKRHYSEPPPPTYSHRQDDDYTRTAPINYAHEAPANDYMGLDDDFLFDMASTSKLSPTDAGGLRGLFFLECSRLVEQREFEFRRFTDFSVDLERAIAYKMDFTRDRQERAIYAFTLVTIVFLPISAVSSIFGMNTTDVRDMPYSQWLYWAVAIPVTILVILIGLWFMGELGNITRWLLRRSGNWGPSTYTRPAALPQTVETAYWTSAPAHATTEVAEYSPPYETGPGMRRRVQAQVYYPPTHERVHRSRTLDVGYSSRP